MRKYIILLVFVSGFMTNMFGQISFDCNAIQYYDWDGDGYGDINYPHNPQNPSQYQYTIPSYAVLQKDNKVCNASDCDDSNPLINPDTYWATIVDGDNDGHYTITSVIQGCDNIPQGMTMIDLNNTANLLIDCNDSDDTLQSFKAYYRDVEGDGFGDIEDVVYSCSGSVPSGYVENGGDSCPDTFGQYNGCPDVTNQTSINQNKNYVHSIAYQRPTQLQDINSVTSKDKIEQVAYFDELGRSQIQIAIGQSPKDGRDIKTIATYDGYGRSANAFLPYVTNERGGNFTDAYISDVSGNVLGTGEVRKQQQFYHNKYSEDVTSATNINGFLTVLDGVANLPSDLRTLLDEMTIQGTLSPSFSAKVFDNVDRAIEHGAPGEDWSLLKGHTIKMTYQLNDSLADAVKRFDVIHPAGLSQNISLLYTNTYYPTGQLSKTITKDENWKPNQSHDTDHTVEEFTNKSGQVVLKRTYDGANTLDTYYIYDKFGNLTYVLPPMASVQPDINANDVLNKFCYQYKYDHRNRLIEKRLPGKGWEYIVYDKLDRPILTQDVNLRNDEKWLFTKYDALGRVVYTGKFGDKRTRHQLQTIADTYPLNESKTTTPTIIDGTNVFYTNDAYPNDATIELYTINYYDDYLWDVGTSYEANYNLTNTVGVTTTGIIHKKTAGLSASWTNSGFNTEETIQGDGYIQYSITQTDKRIMIGLSHEATAGALHYSSINYRIYTGYGTDKRVRVYKDGTLESFPNTYCEIGDTFKIERSGNQILFKQNGETFHAVTTDYTGTLVGDASFYDPETAIENVHIGYSIMGQTFTQNVKGLTTGSKVRVLDTNDWITTVSHYDEKGRTIHLTSNNNYLDTSDAVSSLLDFSGKVLKTNTTHKQANNDPVVTSDEYVYDTNNRLLYQTKQINNEDKELIARNHYDELGQLIQKQVGASLPEISDYTNVHNIVQDKDKLTKTSANAWDGGVNTTSTITGDGYLSYMLPQSTKTMMVGLSNVAGDNSYGSIKYAIYTSSIGGIHIRENGSTIWNVSSYVGGDEFKIERRGSTIYYLKNNETFYISNTVDNGAALLGDVAMYHINANIKDLVLIDLEKELQEVDYTYNVRGWLKGINDVNNQGDDLFSFAVQYNDIADPTKQLFNGNISSTLWKTKGQDSSLKDYVYEYDPLNRIISGIDNTANYNLDVVSYDLNGNITDLTRKGHINSVATDFGTMDNLSYQYSGNQLLNVTDTSAVTFGFNDGNANSSTDPGNTNNDFVYDDNGNMIKDKNKGITNISYNHLNLPTQITFDTGSSISYFYDATGVKQQKVVNDQSNENVQDTYYAGNYIYKKSNAQAPIVLTFFNSEEGYIEPQLDPSKPAKITGFNYTYQYKDHLGNIRLSYEDINGNGVIKAEDEIKEENHYYPFGLKHKGYNANQVGRDHKFEYLNQENHEDLGLNWVEFRHRFADLAIGRFFGVDPVSAEYMSISTYQFAHNNPVWKIEIEGLEGGTNSGHDEINKEPGAGSISFKTMMTDFASVKRSNTSVSTSSTLDKGERGSSRHSQWTKFNNDMSDLGDFLFGWATSGSEPTPERVHTDQGGVAFTTDDKEAFGPKDQIAIGTPDETWNITGLLQALGFAKAGNARKSGDGKTNATKNLKDSDKNLANFIREGHDDASSMLDQIEAGSNILDLFGSGSGDDNASKLDSITMTIYTRYISDKSGNRSALIDTVMIGIGGIKGAVPIPEGTKIDSTKYRDIKVKRFTGN